MSKSSVGLYLDLGKCVEVPDEVHAVGEVLSHALGSAGAHQCL